MIRSTVPPFPVNHLSPPQGFVWETSQAATREGLLGKLLRGTWLRLKIDRSSSSKAGKSLNQMMRIEEEII